MKGGDFIPFYENNWDYKAVDGFNKRSRELQKDFDEHKKSEQCTGKPDCKICKSFEQSLAVSNPCLP